MKTQKVWFVTGTSKGLGLTLVKRLLDAGEKVAATTRNLSDLHSVLDTTNPNLLPLEVNLLSEESIRQAFEKTATVFGRVDVVVNNAGYGQFGTVEELSDAETRKNFDVNVFGLLNVTRQAMPYLREQGSGHILNISSIGGFTAGFSGWGIYCATKFAVAAISESLAEEAKEFGVHVTVVYPGYFRTNFLNKDSMALPAKRIAAYGAARASQELHENEYNGNQPGDPEKAAEVMMNVVASENPVVHLFLGQDAYDRAHEKMATVQKDMAVWETQATATAFAAVAAQ